MTLGEKQELFASLLPYLLLKAEDLGFKVRIGDLYRDSRVHGVYGEKKGYGSQWSMHKLRLAVDLNLMKEGILMTFTEEHKELGMWWESLHPLCRWGGRFNDGNHYSLTHDDRA